MVKEKRIAIGHEFYKEFIDENYYYVDKTLMIQELLDAGNKVNLFTRPRRFGKTLALTMLKAFFEQEMDRSGKWVDQEPYFRDMKIASAGEEYMQHLGRYPVIFLTLKSAKQPDFKMAYACLAEEVANEYRRHKYILESDILEEDEREKYRRIMAQKAERQEYATSLKFLSECLYQYHGTECIILIDEYDVPLEHAYFTGFYEEMIQFIRVFFESALKTNLHLKMAVITGCLRISRESIFTGLNNLRVISVLNEDYAECFGFTPDEVQEMLEFYGLGEKMDEARYWYDGYLFGQTEVYNPWSIINYIYTAKINKQAFPRPYWSNTSSNSIIRDMIEQADDVQKEEIEELISGGTIEKPIHEDVTYAELRTSRDNLWNFLFFTGYLKKAGERFEGEDTFLQLTIPNAEIRYIYRNAIMEWFQRRIREVDNTPMYEAMLDGDAQRMAQEISQRLFQSISYYDYAEAYYHGILIGILQNIQGYRVQSNREEGNGRPDILVRSPSIWGKAVILEIKTADKAEDLRAKVQEAKEQILAQRYIEGVKEDGYEDVIAYGIAFYKKNCVAELV